MPPASCPCAIGARRGPRRSFHAGRKPIERDVLLERALFVRDGCELRLALRAGLDVRRRFVVVFAQGLPSLQAADVLEANGELLAYGRLSDEFVKEALAEVPEKKS